jgi:hypothetical protein
LARSVRRKSNGAAAGLNSLTYVPYKKCKAILITVHKIIKKIWKTKDVPEDWAQAYVVLLAKNPNKLDDPSEFRPIAITNTVGKIFFSVISDRLQTFMVKNNYISRSVQKGFLSGIAGCLEHSFTLFEALREAKEEQRQIVVACIDLANAYGSVRHNLIQFALNWYHVPPDIQKLIFNYYNKLMANVQTKEWSTGFFLFEIGLFQGCVLSTILFDCVFQLLLDMLAPINHTGYSFKKSEVTLLHRAYADDLALSTSNPVSMQKACDTTDVFLEWSQTMKAKPTKCVTVGFRQFDKRTDSGKYTRVGNTRYAPYNPNVRISGKEMLFLLDLTKPDDVTMTLLRDHFKFLGRWIGISLDEKKVKIFVKSCFLKDVALVEKSKVNGLMKLWLYQFYILSHLSWPFLVHDFSYSFAVELEMFINSKLKKWAKLYRGADLGSLFRSRSMAGLGLTSITHHFTKMQVVKCSLLQNSVDPIVQTIYKQRAAKTMKWRVKWSAARATQIATADATRSTLFPSVIGRRGLGHGFVVAKPSKSQFRKMVMNALDKHEQDRLSAHSHSLSRQSAWTNWHETTMPKKLIYGPGPHVIAFVLNATTILLICSSCGVTSPRTLATYVRNRLQLCTTSLPIAKLL